MSVVYRSTRLDELDDADALVVSSINDLTERHGFGQMASRSVPRFQAFCLDDDPRGLWTAEEDDAPVGFAWSWVCDDFWFLSQLFVTPGLQSGGIGRALLQRTLDHADAVGATRRALITFAFNTVSQGLYIQHGFLPRWPIYLMSVARERLGERSPRSVVETCPLDASDGTIAELAEVDRAALGVSRAKHHRLLAGEAGIRALGFLQGGRIAGYCYISQTGHIGPLAVTSPDLTRPAFETALATAADCNVDAIS